MAIKTIKSRIHHYFSSKLVKDLYSICRNTRTSDNNIKVNMVIELLKAYEIDFVELGPGTNRLAILIDEYVYKIALDKWGIQDNINEFSNSKELQPFVVKTYETNGIISVCEYVTVISKEEFMESKDSIRQILSILADSYLLGDVGSINKNFANWGYRDSGELVILDFAYIYRVQGSELLCSNDQTILEYDENFHNLFCPKCRKKYTFIDVRRKIPFEFEKKENEAAMQLSYKLTKSVQTFKVDETNQHEIINEEENKMKKRKYYDEDYMEPEVEMTQEELDEEYDNAVLLAKRYFSGEPIDDDPQIDENIEEVEEEVDEEDDNIFDDSNYDNDDDSEVSSQLSSDNVSYEYYTVPHIPDPDDEKIVINKVSRIEIKTSENENSMNIRHFKPNKDNESYTEPVIEITNEQLEEDVGDENNNELLNEPEKGCDVIIEETDTITIVTEESKTIDEPLSDLDDDLLSAIIQDVVAEKSENIYDGRFNDLEDNEDSNEDIYENKYEKLAKDYGYDDDDDIQVNNRKKNTQWQ